MNFTKILKNDLTPSQLELIMRAKEVMVHSYNIYSHFYVGAAVRTKSGQIYVGTNVENASYGLAICAEPSALTSAFSAGDPCVVEMAVIGAPSPDAIGGSVTTPCGRCRQMIYETSEVSGTDIVMFCCNADLSDIIQTTISELLPLPFGPKDLGATKDLNKYLLQVKAPKGK